MKNDDLERKGLMIADAAEMEFIRGGVSSVAQFDLWGMIKDAFNFLMEYKKEILKGFKRGWNNA